MEQSTDSAEEPGVDELSGSFPLKYNYKLNNVFPQSLLPGSIHYISRHFCPVQEETLTVLLDH